MGEIQFPLKVGARGSLRPLWTVTEAMLTDWQQDFPHLDVLAEVKKARAWCVANPAKRKTASGMPRFLVGWFMRAEGTGTLERRVRQRRDVPSDPGLWARADVYARRKQG